jgi:uncharacterized membrane protein YoaK (UPF0700 family)
VKRTAFVGATEPPRAVPVLLAAVAGYVDACTFLGLYGFFVAQVTGSFVIAGAHLVVGWSGAAALLAVPVFFAGGVAATLAAIIGQPRFALASALVLETLLLLGFIATFAFAGPFEGPQAPFAAVAAMFGLGAMGVQSALVRLTMRGVASTNVMTTNTSQIAVDATQLAFAWLRQRGDDAAETSRQRELCRRRLCSGLLLPLAFLAGTAAGAIAFAAAGFGVLAAPVIAVGGLALWAARDGATAAP